jgi:formylglycine-generating enzyme required for sulfatase activity
VIHNVEVFKRQCPWLLIQIPKESERSHFYGNLSEYDGFVTFGKEIFRFLSAANAVLGTEEFSGIHPVLRLSKHSDFRWPLICRRPDALMQSAPTPTKSDPFAAFGEGNKLAGCYLLKRRIEGTGNRVVWMAHDEVLGKDVSLHFVPTLVLEDEEALAVLRHEAKRNRQLIHPSILRVYDLVEEDGWLAVSMDAFTGGTLATRQVATPQGIFEPAEIKSWIESICQTLDDAHRIKLVHGDVRPENVIIEEDGRVRVASFGMSICIKHALGELETGESAHQSAQQLEGAAPTPADDLFGVGVLMHLLLAGAAPFSGPSDRGTAQSVAEHRAKLGKKGGPISPEWEKLVASCLERSPAARPKSMAEIVRRLAGDPVPQDAASEPPKTEEVKEPTAKGEEKAGALAEPLGVQVEGARPVATDPVVGKVDKAADVAPVPAEPTAKAEEVTPSNIVEAPPTAKKEPAVEKTATEGKAASEAKPGPKRPTDSPRKQPAKRLAMGDDADEYVPGGGGGSQWKMVGVGAVLLAVMAGTMMYFTGAGPKPKASRAAKSEPTPVPVNSPTAETKTLDPLRMPVTEPPPDPERTATKPEKETPEKPATPETNSKTAEVDAAQTAVDAAGKAVQDAQQRKQESEMGLVDVKAKFEEKAKSLTPLQRAGDEVSAVQKKRDTEARAAMQAAEQSKQVAADKMRLAEESRRSFAIAEETLKTLKTMAADPATGFAPIKKAADEMAAIRKKREEEAKTAEAAAQKAQQLADQKAAVAERASKTAVDGDAKGKSKITTKENASGELKNLQKEIEEKERAVAAATKALAEAMAQRDQQGAAEQLKVNPNDESPKETIEVKPPDESKDANFEEKRKEAAKQESPSSDTEPPKGAMAGPGFVNSLGMKFVPVGDALFSVWQTRVKDFEAFAEGPPAIKSTGWRDPGFKQGPEHPAVNVTWDEARLFCKWLTTRERKKGLIGPDQEYRLPTDREWSTAVGLGEEPGPTPEARDMGVSDVYPWGIQWPPPAGAGNYTGEETGSDVAIKGYNDAFPWTSPVGSFPPNKYGIYDMGGNVWQWVMDNWNGESRDKVLRGASWYNGALPLSLLSSCRVHAAPDSSTDNYGFRVIIAKAMSESGERAARK